MAIVHKNYTLAINKERYLIMTYPHYPAALPDEGIVESVGSISATDSRPAVQRGNKSIEFIS